MIKAFRQWRRRRAAEKIEIADAQWQAAEYPLPFLDRLSDDERRRLRDLAREFIAAKEWTGAHGLVLTADMQLSIALQACLPVLKLGLDAYDGWVGIVVYPGDFVIPRQVMDEDGVVHEYDDPVLGEAWEGGPVLVSWFDKLDMGNGAVDGIPALPADMSRREWIAAFEPAYADFCRRVDAGEETAIDPYAAEHPAEFFAVLSEVFFEAPDLLRDEYPAVYAQLGRYYRQDPLASPDGGSSSRSPVEA